MNLDLRCKSDSFLLAGSVDVVGNSWLSLAYRVDRCSQPRRKRILFPDFRKLTPQIPLRNSFLVKFSLNMKDNHAGVNPLKNLWRHNYTMRQCLPERCPLPPTMVPYSKLQCLEPGLANYLPWRANHRSARENRWYSVLLFRSQWASHVVQQHHAGKQATHWRNTNKELTSIKMVIFFFCLVPVRCLRSIMAHFVPRDWPAAKGPNNIKSCWWYLARENQIQITKHNSLNGPNMSDASTRAP